MPRILSMRTVLISVVALLASSPLPSFLRDQITPPALPVSYYSLDALSPRTSDVTEAVLATATGLEFCEDATEWASQEKLVLSCDPNRLNWNTVMGPLRDPSPLGHLFVLDPVHTSGAPQVAKVEVLGFPTANNFHPLGIDIFPGGSGLDDILFVVNHQKDVNTIETFSLVFSPEGIPTATYLQTISHPSFSGAPNSVLPTSPTSFYVTHDHHFNRRSGTIIGTILNAVETIAALPLSRVDFVSFNGETTAVENVATGIGFANGVAMSHAGSEVAVASSTHRKVYFYRRHLLTNALEYFESVSLPFAVDNLSTAPLSPGQAPENSTYIAAGHPYYFSLLARSRGKESIFGGVHPMSWVVAISRKRSDSIEDQAPYPITKRARRSATRDVLTLFQSKGGSSEGAYGTSTTGVYGVTRGKPWLVVCGLYAKGVQVIRRKA